MYITNYIMLIATSHHILSYLCSLTSSSKYIVRVFIVYIPQSCDQYLWFCHSTFHTLNLHDSINDCGMWTIIYHTGYNYRSYNREQSAYTCTFPQLFISNVINPRRSYARGLRYSASVFVCLLPLYTALTKL